MIINHLSAVDCVVFLYSLITYGVIMQMASNWIFQVEVYTHCILICYIYD